MTKWTKLSLVVAAGWAFTAGVTLAVFAYTQAHFNLTSAVLVAGAVFVCTAAGTIALHAEAARQMHH